MPPLSDFVTEDDLNDPDFLAWEERMKKGDQWRADNHVPLTENGLSVKNQKRLDRARRNRGAITTLRFDFKKGIKK